MLVIPLESSLSFSGGVDPDALGLAEEKDLFFDALSASHFLVDGDLCLPDFDEALDPADDLDPVDVTKDSASSGWINQARSAGSCCTWTGRLPERDALEAALFVTVTFGHFLEPDAPKSKRLYHITNLIQYSNGVASQNGKICCSFTEDIRESCDQADHNFQ